MRGGRGRAILVVMALGLASCTASAPCLVPTTLPPSTSAPAGAGAPSSLGLAGDPLCNGQTSSPSSASPPTGETLPPSIAAVAEQIQLVRELRFEHPVAPEPVSRERLSAFLSDSLQRDFPPDLAHRESLAWAAIGVIPDGTDLLQVVKDFSSSQVIGVYDSRAKRLLFIGSPSPSPLERFVLSHELTHALDDQHFNLGTLDTLANTCQDDRQEAFLALAEGDAVVSSLAWARANLSPDELGPLQQEAGAAPAAPASVPPFVSQMLEFPYPNGEAFVTALQARGGEAAVDRAFRDPPLSTEQILHPGRYPSDAPQAVAVPDLGPGLGSGWSEIDVEQVGEGFLRLMLGLRESDAVSSDAAGGWDGGQFRAWANGDRVAVEMDTVWDSRGDADQFAQALRTWSTGRSTVVTEDGSRVRALFASDPTTLDALRLAAGV